MNFSNLGSRRSFFLVLIIIVAFFLRFYRLGENPPSLTWDETAWGYNAYSFGIDGKDEFGRFLPLDYIESFGDFKPPLYAYLDVLPIKLFGLNEFAVRVPSAFLGVLTVLITYFLVSRLFKDPSSHIALFTSFLLAISPWHINLSRAAFEANVATFFIILGMWLFLVWEKENKWFHLSLSIIAFSFSIYTFNTARIVVPLLVLFLSIFFIKKLLSRKRDVLIAVIVGILFLLPIMKFLLSPQASLRFKEVNIFSEMDLIYRTNQEIANDGGSRFSKIIHNRRFAYTVEYLRHYFDHFHPSFLFIRGDGNPKFSTQDVGSLYLWDLPFFVAGILFLFRKREDYWWIVPAWLLIGIIPAAVARETPHALRIETTLPTFQIITAYGFYQAVLGIKYYVVSKNRRYLILTTLFLLLFFNILYYLHGYYTHYPREYSREWQYGYKESILYAQSVQDEFDNIYFTTELGRPHIYYLFYTKTSPLFYRNNLTIRREPYGFVHVERIGKYYFAKNLIADNKKQKNLFMDLSINVPSSAKIIKTFYLLNGEPVLTAHTI